MLKTQMFIGSYEEKRYVEAVDSYRDVVRIDSEETQFIGNLQVVTRKLKQELDNGIAWIGITNPNTIGAPAGFSLWTILPIEVFGKYWFKVKSVAFSEHEVILKLDVVRPVKSEQSTGDSGTNESRDFDLKAFMLDASSTFRSSFTSWIKTNLTLTNIRSTIIFLGLLMTSIVAGAVNLVKYLMEYLLKVMSETSKIIKVCTPILITCIELVRSVLFGILSMIVTLVRGKQLTQQVVYVHSPPNRPPQYMLQYPTRRSARQRGSTVTIEPIDD